MKINNKYILSFMLVFLITGCAGTSSVIKKVDDVAIEDLKASSTSKPIQLSKVVIKLKRGEHIGAYKAGILCVPHGDLNWKGGKLNVTSDELTETFKEELEQYSFKVVGDTDALFEDASTWKSEILVGGLIKELKANICYPQAGFGNFSNAKGEAFVKVDWQIYSKLDRAVVHSVQAEGSSIATESTEDGGTVAILNAFAQAARNLLADAKFREIVSKGGVSVKETNFRTSQTITIAPKKSVPVTKEKSDWLNSVVTVFAGRGHGSGFIISDNLIMTNQHVVGESNSVSVKFDSGLEVIGKVIASNSARDVAIVKVDASLPKHFNLERTKPDVGSKVYAIGSPLDEKLSSTITSGIVSNYREQDNKTLIQSDVQVLPGNSGGPLVNEDGKVVGITVSGIVINNSVQGVNFFIPIDDALKSLGE
jgi:serine protease Do